MAPIPRPADKIYDFGPFLDCPAVQLRTEAHSGVFPVVTIPKTKIPSPLAPDIAPDTLYDLKEYLCGSAPPGSQFANAGTRTEKKQGLLSSAPLGQGQNHNLLTLNENPIGKQNSKHVSPNNGPEIWASWKHAYDLWNGHFIPGRVNKSWVGSEYERIQKETEAAKRASKNTKWSIVGDPAANKFLTANDEEDGEADRGKEGAAKNEISKEAFQLSQIGAGFIPLKLFPEFQDPEDVEFGQDFPEAEGEWQDRVRNTVWRPRRVGERDGETNIDIDDDVDTWFQKQMGGAADRSGFNGWVDGGVDCGRSPFPVLRPRTTYSHSTETTKQHEYAKLLDWDGVTGTIFNMPTSALKSTPVASDRRLATNQAIYGNDFRDNRADRYGWETKGTFPLDIRRVLRTKAAAGSDKESKELKQPEEPHKIVNPDGELPLRKRRAVPADDPWFVTDDQKTKRDVPTRFQPPAPSRVARKIGKDGRVELLEVPDAGDLFPINASKWKEQNELDEALEAQYFVTNLHGGTLLINGMEVKKGFVAGPLPSFAIIECPGGQIAFWWGIGGRDHGRGQGTLHDSWVTLRQKPGWEHVARPAGLVWKDIIVDRIYRERTGEDLVDDTEWQEYKAAWQRSNNDVFYSAPLGGVPEVWNGKLSTPARIFASPEDELKYLVIKTEAQRRQRLLEGNARGALIPASNATWRGPIVTSGTPAAAAALEASTFWSTNKGRLLKQQRLTANLLKTKMSKEAAKERALVDQKIVEFIASKPIKRKNDGSGIPPHPKRFKDDKTSTIQDPENKVEFIPAATFKRPVEETAQAAKPPSTWRLRKEKSDGSGIPLYPNLFKNDKTSTIQDPESKVGLIPAASFKQPAEETAEATKGLSIWSLTGKLVGKYKKTKFQNPQDLTPEAAVEREISSWDINDRDGKPSFVAPFHFDMRQVDKKRNQEMREAGNKDDDAAQIAAERQRLLEKKQQERSEVAARKLAEQRRKEEQNRLDALKRIENEEKQKQDLAAARQEAAQKYATEVQGPTQQQQPNSQKPEDQKPQGQKPESQRFPATGHTPGGYMRPGFDDEATKEAIHKSNLDFKANQDQEMEAAITKSQKYDVIYAEKRDALDSRAAASYLTPEEYAKLEGFDSISDYLHHETEKVVKRGDDGENLSEEEMFLVVNRTAYRMALTDGLEAVRRSRGMTMEELLADKGWTGMLAEYLQSEMDTITVADMPNVPIPMLERGPPKGVLPKEKAALERRNNKIRQEINKARTENERRWKALAKKIHDAAEWETAIEVLEQTGGAGEDVYDIEVGKGLAF